MNKLRSTFLYRKICSPSNICTKNVDVCIRFKFDKWKFSNTCNNYFILLPFPNNFTQFLLNLLETYFILQKSFELKKIAQYLVLESFLNEN